MSRGLSREDSARFAFLLATPVILAAGALKIPDLLGPLGNGIGGQNPARQRRRPASARTCLSGSCSGTCGPARSPPFGVYCLIAGLASVLYLGL